jgi:hypothetical protein
VLPENGVDVARLPVRPMAGHILPVIVGAVVVAELKLPLTLRNGEPDGVRRRPLGPITLRWSM